VQAPILTTGAASRHRPLLRAILPSNFVDKLYTACLNLLSTPAPDRHDVYQAIDSSRIFYFSDYIVLLAWFLL